MRLDVDALYADLERRRSERRIYWQDVATEANVCKSTLTRISRGLRPDVDGLVKLLNWLGTTDLGRYVAGGQNRDARRTRR